MRGEARQGGGYGGEMMGGGAPSCRTCGGGLLVPSAPALVTPPLMPPLFLLCSRSGPCFDAHPFPVCAGERRRRAQHGCVLRSAGQCAGGSFGAGVHSRICTVPHGKVRAVITPRTVTDARQSLNNTCTVPGRTCTQPLQQTYTHRPFIPGHVHTYYSTHFVISSHPPPQIFDHGRSRRSWRRAADCRRYRGGGCGTAGRGRASDPFPGAAGGHTAGGHGPFSMFGLNLAGG